MKRYRQAGRQTNRLIIYKAHNNNKHKQTKGRLACVCDLACVYRTFQSGIRDSIAQDAKLV